MTTATDHIARVIEDSGEVYPMEPVFQEILHFAITPSTDVKTLQRELAIAYEGFARERGIAKELAAALVIAEAALADVGDADREPGDDLAWCEARTAEALPTVRAALSKVPQ